MAMTWPALAKQAVARQAWQSVVAAAVATLALLVAAPMGLLVRAIVLWARQHNVPFDEVPVLAALTILVAIVEEELIDIIIRGRTRLCVLARTVVMQLCTWLAAVAAAKQLGVEQLAARGLLVCALVYLVARPAAVALRPDQRCGARLRRATRELRTSAIKLSTLGTGFSVVLYVYMTVYTQLAPFAEVLVMGLAMPLLQALFMSLMAQLVERHERKVRRAMMARRVAAAGVLVLDGPGHGGQFAGVERSGKSASSDGSVAATPGSGGSQVPLLMVMVVELCYATAAFSTLVLAESERSFFLSLTSMFCIEVVQVALHVKARRVVSRVVSENAADTLLGNDMTIREWLLYQELGEKTGVLVALGQLAIDRALGRDVLQALSPAKLAWRGAAMVLSELVADVAKDVTSQVLGVLPAGGTKSSRVTLQPLAASYAICLCLLASFQVQAGLALGGQA